MKFISRAIFIFTIIFIGALSSYAAEPSEDELTRMASELSEDEMTELSQQLEKQALENGEESQNISREFAQIQKAYALIRRDIAIVEKDLEDEYLLPNSRADFERKLSNLKKERDSILKQREKNREKSADINQGYKDFVTDQLKSLNKKKKV